MFRELLELLSQHNHKSECMKQLPVCLSVGIITLGNFNRVEYFPELIPSLGQM
jgi:hypothetical protein